MKQCFSQFLAVKWAIGAGPAPCVSLCVGLEVISSARNEISQLSFAEAILVPRAGTCGSSGTQTGRFHL